MRLNSVRDPDEQSGHGYMHVSRETAGKWTEVALGPGSVQKAKGSCDSLPGDEVTRHCIGNGLRKGKKNSCSVELMI